MKFWKKKRKTVELVPEPVISDRPERIALFGDIHANLEALEAVLTDINEQGSVQIVCVGDIVGYAANPSECLKVIRDLNCPVVRGNHDSYAATDDSLKDFNMNALNAILWTRKHLSDEEKTWIKGLPMTVDLDWRSELKTQALIDETTKHLIQTSYCRLVHSSLLEPEAWHYILKPERALPALQTQEPELVFFGHTHVPAHYSFNPESNEFKSEFPLGEGTHKLEPGWKHLINPGSVGQPRDRDTRASYAIYNPEARTIEIRRVEYDISAVQQKIEDAELPLRNAERLAKGQ